MSLIIVVWSDRSETEGLFRLFRNSERLVRFVRSVSGVSFSRPYKSRLLIVNEYNTMFRIIRTGKV